MDRRRDGTLVAHPTATQKQARADHPRQVDPADHVRRVALGRPGGKACGRGYLGYRSDSAGIPLITLGRVGLYR
jgi:hypothetical protein